MTTQNRNVNVLSHGTTLAALLTMGACDLRSGPSPLALETTGPSTGATSADPAYAMTTQQIKSAYSTASCNALDDAPVPEGGDSGGIYTGTDYYRSGVRGRVKVPAVGANPAAFDNLTRFDQSDAVRLPNTLYFFSLDTPTRRFETGFPLFDGSLLEGSDLQPLTEYFRIDFDGMVTLKADQPDGDYEFALLSDDGARLSMGVDDRVLINNPGVTASQLMCAAPGVKVSMKQGYAQPFKLAWFQGPRYHIANMLLWRKASATREPLCGNVGNETWFNYEAGPYVPKQDFKDLKKRGWSVVGFENLRLPTDEVLNPCLSERVKAVFDAAN